MRKDGKGRKWEEKGEKNGKINKIFNFGILVKEIII
jgi:hypothetical protein